MVTVGSEHSPVGGVFETLEREEAETEENSHPEGHPAGQKASCLYLTLSPKKNEAAAEKNDEKNDGVGNDRWSFVRPSIFV
jgi:hypothetical protein